MLPGRPGEAPGARSRWQPDRGATTWTTADAPKPLSWRVQQGLGWLVEHQLPDGGWGEGNRAVMQFAGGVSGPVRDPSTVAETCMASLALIRSGSTPREGPYCRAICGGVGYVRSQVEESDDGSLSVTRVHGTTTQVKLGPNIDTYLACMLLAEVRGRMPDETSDKAVDIALHKVIGKIERHLARDGPSEASGWLPFMSQAITAKGLNRARQAGARVSDIALTRMEDDARIAYRTGAWPVAISGGRTTPAVMDRARERGPVRAGHKAHRRPAPIERAPSAAQGSSRSLAVGVGDQEPGRGTMLTSAGPTRDSSAAGEAAGNPASAGRRSMLGGAGPVPSPAAVGDAANGGEDGGRRPELSATGPASPSHKIGGRSRGGAAGLGADAGAPPTVGGAPELGGRMLKVMPNGLELYGWSACLGMLQDSLNTGRAEVPRLGDLAARSRDPNERADAGRKLARIADAEGIQREAEAALVARLDRPGFLHRIDFCGGEEFLTYMILAESLAVRGDEAWRRWDSGMTDDLNRVQNADGSWTGSHCITGRTFCTAAVLLTLMADRTPIPVPVRAEVSRPYSR